MQSAVGKGIEQQGITTTGPTTMVNCQLSTIHEYRCEINGTSSEKSILRLYVCHLFFLVLPSVDEWRPWQSSEPVIFNMTQPSRILLKAFFWERGQRNIHKTTNCHQYWKQAANMSGEGDVKGPPGPGEEYEEIREQVCPKCFSTTDLAHVTFRSIEPNKLLSSSPKCTDPV